MYNSIDVEVSPIGARTAEAGSSYEKHGKGMVMLLQAGVRESLPRETDPGVRRDDDVRDH